MKIRKIVIRVYGVWIDGDQLLLSDEHHDGAYFTKFPGGGLELGESVIDCLKREWKEELGVEIEVLRHFYTTDFFQISEFDDNVQILSIYYLIEPIVVPEVELSTVKADNQAIKEAEQTFRWVKLSELNESEVTYPIDRKVAKMLMETFL